MGTPCDDGNCDKHHPKDCITIEQTKICFDKYCLRRHLKWARWLENLLPKIPDEGGWDGWDWKVPSKELKKYWKRIDENEKEKEKEMSMG